MIDSMIGIVEKAPIQRTLLSQLRNIAALLDPGQQTALFVTVRDWQKLFLEVKLEHPKANVTPKNFGDRFRIGADGSGMIEVRNSGTEDQRVCDALNSQIFLPDEAAWKAYNLRTG